MSSDNPFSRAQLLSDHHRATTLGVEGLKQRYVDGALEIEALERLLPIAIQAGRERAPQHTDEPGAHLHLARGTYGSAAHKASTQQ